MVFMKPTMDEVRTAARSMINSSGAIRAARENWLNGCVEKIMLEISARQGEQLKAFQEIQRLIEEAWDVEERGFNAEQAEWRIRWTNKQEEEEKRMDEALKEIFAIQTEHCS